MFALRPYQQEASDAGVSYLTKPGGNGVIVMPTASGKSLVIADIATRLAAMGRRSIVLQPTGEILKQNMAKIASYGYRPAIYSASVGRKDVGTITLGTIGSVISDPLAFDGVRDIIIDECDVVGPKQSMYMEFLSMLPAARPRVLGFTATPFRLASNSFGSELRIITRTKPRLFRDLVHYTQIETLDAEYYLAPLLYRVAPVIDTTKLKLNTQGSEYDDGSIQQQLIETGFVGKLQDEVTRALDEGRKNVLVFTRFVGESERLAKVIPGCEVVTSDTNKADRRRILDGFTSGQIPVVANVGVVAVGFDFPACECVILGRPTISLRLYYQQVGRIRRPVYADGMPLTTAEERAAAIAAGPKPHGYVVDLVGVTSTFGKVEDLRLTLGGKTGQQWAITSKGRQLTNVYFAQRDQAPPAMKRRQYFAAAARTGAPRRPFTRQPRFRW